MIFKSYILEQSFEHINNYNLILFYGENQGLKKDFKENLRTQNKGKKFLIYFKMIYLKIKIFYLTRLRINLCLMKKK